VQAVAVDVVVGAVGVVAVVVVIVVDVDTVVDAINQPTNTVVCWLGGCLVCKLVTLLVWFVGWFALAYLHHSARPAIQPCA